MSFNDDELSIAFQPYDFIEWPVAPLEHTISINTINYRAKEIDRKNCRIIYERDIEEPELPIMILGDEDIFE